MELLDQLEAESPEDAALAPKELTDWACIYIRYLQILRKLETAYDQMVHPQKRLDMKRALEACMGRLLEARRRSHANARRSFSLRLWLCAAAARRCRC